MEVKEGLNGVEADVQYSLAIVHALSLIGWSEVS